MEDPFTPSGQGSMSRQRSRPNLALPLPAPPSSRSLSDFGARTPSPTRRPRSPEITGNALRHHLQQLLDQKAGQLQMLGTMGQEIVKQHQELDERIRAFDVGGDDEIGEETKAKLRDLDNAMRAWEDENEGMMRELGAKAPESLDLAGTPTPATETAAPSTLTRRQRNAQHRAMGMEFASEIGQNLIQEVRRLQLLLSERDRALEKFSEEKENWIAEEKGLQDALRSERSSNDRYKEENWNLEVSLQELRSNHADVNDQLVKTTAEHARISKSLVSAREIAEMHKTDYEKQAALVVELKQKHETEMAQARRTTAGLQRDKSDLLGELNVERQRRVSGLRGRGSRSVTASPNISISHAEEDDEDVFGGANVSPRKRPGFGDDDKALSPSQLYESDFESPAGTPARGEKEYIRSPLGEVFINEAQELRDQLDRANAELATLKGEKRVRKTSSVSIDEFGSRTPGWEDEDMGSGRGRGGSRGRRGRGRGFAASLSRKLGLSRVGSGLSNSDKSFSSGSSATPDLLRTRAALAMDSPDSMGSCPRIGAFSSDTDLAAALGNANALADELGANVQYSDMGTMTDPVEFASSTSNSSVPALESAPTQSSIAQSSIETPTRPMFAVGPNEVTPTKKATALPPSNLAFGFSRDISLGDVSTTETDTDEFTDARESVGTVTPSVSISELATDAEAYETGREYQTSMAEDSSASDSEDEDNTRRGTVLGLNNLARRMASRDRVNERVVEKIVEVEKIVHIEVPKKVFIEKIVEVPVEKIVEVEKIIHVEVPKEILIEKIVEVQVPVDKLVEVERIVEVEKRVEVPVEKIVEIERIVEVPVDRIVEVQKIVEVEKRVEIPIETIIEKEKIVEVPVDRIVEKIIHVDKIIEVPVEKIVERMVEVEKIVEVDKLVDRIVEVEKIVEVTKIVEVEKIVEKIVDREVEVPKIVEVEKIVEKVVEVEKPVDRVVEVQVDRDVERVVEVERIVEKIVEVPKIVEVERVVEKIVDRIVEVPKEVIVERRVEVPVEVIKEVEKIVDRQAEVPFEVIREVEKIVEKRIEIPVEVIREVEKIVEVERIVEKTIEVPVEVKRTVEKIIEVPVDRIVEVEKRIEIEKIVEVPVEKIVEKIVEIRVPTEAKAEGPVNDLGMFRITSGNYDFLGAPPTAEALNKRASSSSLADGLPSSSDKAAPAIDGLPDTTRPPTMHMPPPPSVPPPAGAGKRMSTAPAPPRPTSPPPEDFVARSVNPSTRRKSKPPVASRTSTMDPPSTASRQPSRVSMKPAATPAKDEAYLKSRESVKAKAQQVIPAPSASNASLSRQASVSSLGSIAPTKEAHGSTDPATIHAITQTMIGEYLWKYTRARLGKGQSENRHKRFFWIHPYTKTLYWSSEDPGSLRASESTSKSVFISSVRAFNDLNNNPPGLYTKSIVVATPGREIQFTAPNQERHELWMSALQFLLQQQGGATMTGSVRSVVKDSTLRPSASRPTLAPLDPALLNNVDDQGRLLKSPLSMRSFKSSSDVKSLSSMTPKAQRAGSSMSTRTPSTMGKRTGTAAFEYIRRHDVPATLHGGHRFKGTYKGAPIADDFDVVMHDDGDDPDESFEGLENVRACCDGRHVVGGHKHHHHTYDKYAPASSGSIRATTPSLRAWSVRSRGTSNADAKSLGESLRGTAKGKNTLRGNTFADVPQTPTPSK